MEPDQPISRRRFELARIATVLYFVVWFAGLMFAVRAVHGLLGDILVCLGFGVLAFPVSISELRQSYQDYLATRSSSER